MTKILIPLDKSAGSRAALPVANWLAHGMDADALILVCVGELPETSELEREEDRALDQVLCSAAKELRDVKIELRTSKAGDPVRGIIDVAREEHVDLIVMATHARSALSELAHGSVAEGVVRSGVAPVTLVRWPDEA
jgi:nucleotide-binding universal stress UspA family protein